MMSERVENSTMTPYEPPELVELGEFSEDTLGNNGIWWEPFNPQYDY
ncbi:lasso RiPP family leader peptide-containing protein [Streptomyces marincola]|nr:lasso RiPP family leader peptide-containing protein [Streptomyces marincola]UCM91415.1 lasso RiPP family leader peptide-containing protein [Streptomyces marincola]